MKMKTAISLPDALFVAGERAAARLGITRSQLYRRALARYLAQASDETITAQLDGVHAGTAAGRLDPLLGALQRASVGRDDEW